MLNKNRFLRVAATIAALCVTGNAADYVPNEYKEYKYNDIDEGVTHECDSFPAHVEVYAVGGGGGGQGGNNNAQGSGSHYAGTGSGGGGGGAAYMIFGITKKASISINVGRGGIGGFEYYSGYWEGWMEGCKGGDGETTSVIYNSIKLYADGGIGGGITAQSLAGGAGGSASVHGLSASAFATEKGSPGKDGFKNDDVRWNDKYSRGGDAGKINNIGYLESFGGDGVIAGSGGGFGGGGSGNYSAIGNNITGRKGFDGKSGQVIVIVTYLRTVTFNSNSGSPNPSPISEILNGAKISKPNDPTRANHEFLGWFTDLNSNIQWDFANNTITKDITLIAKWFDVNEGNAIRMSGDKTYIYDNTEKKLQTIELYLKASDEWVILQEGADFTADYAGSNVNSGTVSATITGAGDYVARIASIPEADKKLSFTIQKRPITVTWDNTALIYNGEPQTPTPISSDPNFPVELKPGTQNTDIGRYNAEAVTSNTNITLSGNTTTYVINPKPIKIIWGNKREFVYNKMIQYPTWSLESDEIDKNHVYIAPTYAVVGEYTIANGLAPVVRIVDEHNSNIYHNNYTLVNTRVDYEIVKKELDVVLKKNGNIVEEVEVSKGDINTVGDVQNALKALIDYKGFATDTINKTSDDKGVLTGEPIFEITSKESGQSLRSVRDGGAIAVSELLQNG
ncbi:MAG: InlB B-repeat-containing protein, partial [Chitinispirillales bacterium]|nr:InlB B-repeat-containing protein [Chitinispirillales bacterium]